MDFQNNTIFEKLVEKANSFLDELQIKNGDPEKTKNDFFINNRQKLREDIFNKKMQSASDSEKLTETSSAKLNPSNSKLYLSRKNKKSI